MTIKTPCCITSRLLPGIQIGNVEISIEYAKRPGDEGRTRYRWRIDGIGKKSYSGDDLQSGCQGGNLQEGLESFLSYLEASSDADLFPKPVVKWAIQNSDEIGMLRIELAETKDVIVE
jgi:hypothetical protein